MKKLTIAELEALFDGPNLNIEIMPDGSLRVKPCPKCKEIRDVQADRIESLHDEITSLRAQLATERGKGCKLCGEKGFLCSIHAPTPPQDAEVKTLWPSGYSPEQLIQRGIACQHLTPPVICSKCALDLVAMAKPQDADAVRAEVWEEAAKCLDKYLSTGNREYLVNLFSERAIQLRKGGESRHES